MSEFTDLLQKIVSDEVANSRIAKSATVNGNIVLLRYTSRSGKSDRYEADITFDPDLSAWPVVRIHMLGPNQSEYPYEFAGNIFDKLKEEISYEEDCDECSRH